jgi:hypothetical protein
VFAADDYLPRRLDDRNLMRPNTASAIHTGKLNIVSCSNSSENWRFFERVKQSLLPTR